MTSSLEIDNDLDFVQRTLMKQCPSCGKDNGLHCERCIRVRVRTITFRSKVSYDADYGRAWFSSPWSDYLWPEPPTCSVYACGEDVTWLKNEISKTQLPTRRILTWPT